MAGQSKAQQETVQRVMHEFKKGVLRMRGTGPKVENPKQAIAIALREAGASNSQSPAEKRKALRATKARERKAGSAEPTRAELYAQAQSRQIAGRSRMSKGELEKALG